MKRVEAVVSFRILTPLALAVLLCHLALLQGAESSPKLNSPLPNRVFSTRTIALSAQRTRPTQDTLSAAATVASSLPARNRKRSAPPDRIGTGSESLPPSPVQFEAAEPPTPPALSTPIKAAGEVKKIPDRPDSDAAQPPVPSETSEVAPAPRPPREQIAAAGQYTLPKSSTLRYQLTSNKFPFTLNADLVWQQDGQGYDARLSFGAFGLSRVQTSRGQVTAEGLAPLRFSDKYRSEVAAHFVREKGKVTFSANTPDVPLLAGAQDRLSIVMQLAAMIAGDPDRFPPATTIALQIVGPRDAEIWLFTLENEETLNLPGGLQPTRKLVRNPRQEFDQKVELWLAPALGYLPARIRITESNGDYVDQKWLSSEPPV
jgi:hypothetical protein